MKFTTILTTAFAALATAAPAPSNEARAIVDPSQLNGLVFNQLDLNYLLNINAPDLALFQRLGQTNNLDLLIFQELFQAKSFSLAALLQFQQLNTLLAIAGTGIFDKFDLSKLALGGLNLGLVNGIGAIDLAPFIDAAFLPRIEDVAKEVKPIIIITK